MKTGRNNLVHSGFDKTFSRLLWNDNHYLAWSHIKDLMLDDLELGLQLCPKIITEHIKLTPFSVMNVHLAAQVLCTSVYKCCPESVRPRGYLKRTNFRVYLFSRAKKNRISRVLIFANDKLLKISRV